MLTICLIYSQDQSLRPNKGTLVSSSFTFSSTLRSTISIGELANRLSLFFSQSILSFGYKVSSNEATQSVKILCLKHEKEAREGVRQRVR